MKPVPEKEIVVDRSYTIVRTLKFTIHNQDARGWFLTHAGDFGVVDILSEKTFFLKVYDGYDIEQVASYILSQGEEGV